MQQEGGGFGETELDTGDRGGVSAMEGVVDRGYETDIEAYEHVEQT